MLIEKIRFIYLLNCRYCNHDGKKSQNESHYKSAKYIFTKKENDILVQGENKN